MRCWIGAVVACALALPGRALAAPRERVPVRVLEIAGSQAYLSAGSEKGLRAGSRVRFGDLEYRVQKTTRSFSVISSRRLRVGDRGTALQSAPEGTDERLPTPRPLAAFADQWPAPVLPASTQQPKPVPLGRMERAPSRVQASLSASAAAFVPLDGATDPVGRGELRGVLRASPFDDLPLTLSADVSVQRWMGRYATGVASGDPRPWLRVRELELALGRSGGYRAALGRVRYAAANLGPLDGGRFEAARWGPVRLAGFGGLLPDPIAGRLARGAGRFGAEVDLRGTSKLQPELTLVAHGSVFDGRIDERRLFTEAQLWPGAHRLSAYAEGAGYDANNPWRRPRFDLVGAGADVDLRFSALRLGARFDMRTPERSRWLASALPATWLCASSASLVPGATCLGNADRRYVAQGFAGWEGRAASLDVVGSWAGSSERELGQHALGSITLRSARLRDRYDLALGASHEGGTLLRASSALRAQAGVGSRDDRIHLSVYYRPARKRYEASVATIWEQGFGAALHASPTPTLSLDLFGDARVGDVAAALIMVTAAYRL